jgi:transposase
MTGLGEILEENRRLRESLEAMTDRLETVQKEVAVRDVMIDTLKANADELARRLELIRLQQSGAQSQRYIPDEQESLFTSDITPPPRVPVPDAQATLLANRPPKPAGKKPRRRKRDALSHLKSRTVRCRAVEDATCAGCGGALNVIGQAESFRVEWVPGHFVVEDVIRDKCACPKCPSEGILTVPAPYAIERALCGNALLARVLVDKFADHIPLNRQVRRMKREGFDIGSNTLAAWVKKSTLHLLSHIAKAVKRDLLLGNFLQSDDTGFPVQDGGDGRLRKGRLWAFTDQEQVSYAFTATKEGKFPAALLEGFAGDLLLVDGGSEFNQAVREHNLGRAGCWSHLRTYFYHARHHHPTESAMALDTIHDLFMMERTLRGLPPDEVVKARQSEAKPIIDGFFAWVRAVSRYMRPKSSLGDAITYASNQEVAMRLHLEHGDLPIHNNLSELMLRQAVVGRKNWLFARSEGGADAAAIAYTLIGSCMLQGIDPHAYLVDVLRELPEWPSNRVGELTPKAWRQNRQR